MLGKTIGRYNILQKLGGGGMAIVYKAYDTHLENEVALKIIRPDRMGSEHTRDMFARFESEAKRVARLSHPNIIPILDYGEFDQTPYLVMKYIPGGSLKDRLGKPIPWETAARMVIPIARALSYAHSQGIIHRDVKPANILLTETGEALLADFGIAKMLYDVAEERSEITGNAIILGTPEYMAPEQASGEKIDQRVDIYALGLIFYEMITGETPYRAENPVDVIHKQINEVLPSPRLFVPNLPESVESVLARALEKDPDLRYPTMDAFIEDLRRVMQTAGTPGLSQAASLNGHGEDTQEGEPASEQAANGGQAAERIGRIPAGWIAIIGGAVALIFLITAVVLIITASVRDQRAAGARTIDTPTPDTATAIPSTTPTSGNLTTPTSGFAATQAAQIRRATQSAVQFATQIAETRAASTATSVVRSTQDAAGIDSLAKRLYADGAISSPDGTYTNLGDFQESWAQIGWYQWWSTNNKLENFVVHAQTNWESASLTADWFNAGCGFVFRAKDENNHYMIYLALDGNVYMKGYVDGYYREFGKGYVGDLPHIQGEADVILAVDGNQITFYVNGKKVFHREETEFSSGDFAFTLVSGTNKGFGTRCTMKNVELWTLKK